MSKMDFVILWAVSALGALTMVVGRLGMALFGLAKDPPAEAEALVHRVIDEDREVRAWFPGAEELASLPLRRAPKAEHARVRVVDVAGFDVSPCGGTHVSHTAQIGVLRIVSTERYKGGTRVSFSAGARARGELLAEAAVLRELGRGLQVPPLEAKAGVERVRALLEEPRYRLSAQAVASEITALPPVDEAAELIQRSAAGQAIR